MRPVPCEHADALALEQAAHRRARAGPRWRRCGCAAPRSRATADTLVRPMPSDGLICDRAPPVAIMAFDGMQSHRWAAPPTMSRSISVTSAPSRAAWVAAWLPAGPPPMITNRFAMGRGYRAPQNGSNARVPGARTRPPRRLPGVSERPDVSDQAGPTIDDWKALASKELKGADPDSAGLGHPRGHRRQAAVHRRATWPRCPTSSARPARASPRSCGACGARCTPTGPGRSASTPASPPPRSPTPSTAATWPPARWACRWPSTWPPTGATTATTPASRATWARPAWPSTRSRT